MVGPCGLEPQTSTVSKRRDYVLRITYKGLGTPVARGRTAKTRVLQVKLQVKKSISPHLTLSAYPASSTTKPYSDKARCNNVHVSSEIGYAGFSCRAGMNSPGANRGSLEKYQPKFVRIRAVSGSVRSSCL